MSGDSALEAAGWGDGAPQPGSGSGAVHVLTTSFCCLHIRPPVRDRSPGELAAWLAAQRDTLSREARGTTLLEYWEQVINDRFK